MSSGLRKHDPNGPAAPSEFAQGVRWLQEAEQEISRFTLRYRVFWHAMWCLGDHITLNPKVPAGVGCAEAVSYVLKEAGVDMPKIGISGTAELFAWLKRHRSLFSESTLDKISDWSAIPRGTIIISPSVMNKDGTVHHGHVGIFTWVNASNPIASNSSKTGEFTEHDNIESWMSEHGDLGVYLFTPRDLLDVLVSP